MRPYENPFSFVLISFFTHPLFNQPGQAGTKKNGYWFLDS